MQPGLAEAQLAEALISLGDWTPAQTYATEAVRPRHTLVAPCTVWPPSPRPTPAAATLNRPRSTVSAPIPSPRAQEPPRLRDRFTRLRNLLADHGSTAGRDAVERIDAFLTLPL